VQKIDLQLVKIGKIKKMSGYGDGECLLSMRQKKFAVYSEFPE
jgi:hypothetical protein